MHFVYFLACLRTGRSYVGQTNHMIRRYRMHLAGLTRTTRERLEQPVVVYWEVQASRSDALRRERYFKRGSGHRVKQDIVRQGLRAFSRTGE